MPVLDFPDLGLIDVPEGADIGKAAEAAKRFVRTTKTSPSPQPMTSAQMSVPTVTSAQPLQPVNQSLQNAIPADAGLRAQSEMDKLRQYRDTIGRMIAPLVGVNFDEMAGDQAKGILRAMVAYHGSPHTFDQFDASKIGTGEGAQVYGHGLYFAENPEVAKEYQREIADVSMNYKGRVVPWRESAGDPELQAARELLKAGGDKQKAVDALYGNALAATTRSRQDHFWNAIEKLKTIEPSDVTPARGSFYSVNVPDEHAANMLNWDRPLSEQPDVLAKLKDISGVEQWWNKSGGGNTSGESLYRALTEDLGGQAQASKALQDAGIPGIKYLDQGSRGIANVQLLAPNETTHGQWLVKSIPNGQVFYRGADEAAARDALSKAQSSGTRNFVVFDPSILQDVKRQ